MNDIEHHLRSLEGITAPVLVMYSPYDKVVRPHHAKRVTVESKPVNAMKFWRIRI